MRSSWSWRKSSYSDMQADQCVEVAWTGRDVLVRDTKDAALGRLVFTAQPWSLFLGTTGNVTKGTTFDK
ncbi:DUF397 domain-containing protein [Streptomyces sp. NPDC096057]|uniref:DUF397 domain-containing protein n=1 Tax=Streptomyces sp. NPDC096057 TaxID=3155543 RepID=UPI0033253B44